ncbi:hypothetical protein LTR56_020883 [Elasticomyces elasticus]|nr:hypothetical protein LTR56_020883 [Elasticomyces elasticus]KAK3654282.1 hypothetical protein LTR22_010758 [Elasticomyces elasticus]KAK4920215.1 hypothetical protein LTR49_012166 [Elasticomyces elasticus]KAK5749814.1 hypothetical protein LTS12_020104 [Elasticomyces elasticus]
MQQSHTDGVQVIDDSYAPSTDTSAEMKEQRPLSKLPGMLDVRSRSLASRNASNERRSDYDPALGTVDLTTLKDAGAEGLSILNRPIVSETLAQAKDIKEQSAPINSNPMSSQFIATGPAPSLPKDVFAQLAYLD